MNGSRLPLALITLLCCIGGRPSWAQTPSELKGAKQAWETGQELFEAGRYEEALDQFSKGHALSHKPEFLFNMAECRRLIEDREGAKALYERFICEASKSPNLSEARLRCNELALGTCSPHCPVHDGQGEPARSSPARGAKAAEEPLSTMQLTPDPAPDATGRGLVGEAPVKDNSTPFYKHWAFWTSVGAAVIAGSVTAAVLATRSDNNVPGHDYQVDYR
jgi:tetratricopeptide (TPR) repeat protein